jgi:hypothetical protein
MFTRSRLTLTAVLAAAVVGAPPAGATVAEQPVSADARGENAASLSDLAPRDGALVAVPAPSPDARGEHAASLSDTPPAADHRSPDARETEAPVAAAQPVVVEVDQPVVATFDWTAAAIGAAGGFALFVLTGAAVALGRRRPPRPTVG